MKRNLKRSFTVIIVLLMCMVVTTGAFAACSHTWLYNSEVEPSGQFTEYKSTTCSNSSTPHSHSRQVWGTTYKYLCARCGAIKKEPYNIYGDWVCSLTDWGR